MITKQLFLITILISLVGHITVFGLASLADIGSTINNDTLFTCNLQEESYFPKESTNSAGLFPEPSSEETVDVIENTHEDTVNLDSHDSKYRRYLVQVKKKIRNRWLYPQKAYKLKEEGTAVVRFSIKEDGNLIDTRVIISSGYESLDRESFQAVKSAAPFAVLPGKYNLTQLHIVARFQYVLDG
jgi:TonB family protein